MQGNFRLLFCKIYDVYGYILLRISGFLVVVARNRFTELSRVEVRIFSQRNCNAEASKDLVMLEANCRNVMCAIALRGKAATLRNLYT